jgi:hypothetical protein
MYEFVKTSTGWRVFWGVDPLGTVPEAKQEVVPTVASVEESAVLPLLCNQSTVKTNGMQTRDRDYVIGVSGDGGKTWPFVKPCHDLTQVQPNLPRDLQLPERPVGVIQ